VNEISLAIHSAAHGGGKYEMTTSFDAGPPMPWAHPTRRLQPLQKLAVPQVFASARASRVAHTASATTGWAIVGTGFVARQFVRGLSLVPGARLSAIVDLSISSAQAFAQAYAPSARVYDTLAGALADERVDIVYLATPNHLHAPQCLEALAARKPVLVEKPFATNAAEARHMVETARKQRVFCMEAMWLRYMPLVQRARSLIAQGAIGSIQTMTADFAYPTDLSDPHNRFLDPVVGSGALLDRGVYCLSLAFLLLGQPTEIMSTASLTPFGIDVHSTMLLRFGSGATASLWCSLTADGSNSAAVFGTKGTLRLHPPFYRPYRLTATTSSTPFTNALPEPRPPGFAVRVKEHVLVQRVLRPLQALLPPAIDIHEPVAGTGYQFEAEEAARCLRDGLLESPLMPLDETLRIMETMDAIRGQWRSNALHAQPIEKSAGV
jgi:predicted dehydrogenase